MTADRAALVERVARAMCASVEARTSDVNVVKTLGYDSVQAFIDAAWPNYTPEATTAIDLIRAEVLEEAANVADVYGPLSAAAIRALKGEKK
jgi:hypothetical protein